MMSILDGDEILYLHPHPALVVVCSPKHPSDYQIHNLFLETIITRDNFDGVRCFTFVTDKSNLKPGMTSFPVMIDKDQSFRYYSPDQIHILLNSAIENDQVFKTLNQDFEICCIWDDREIDVLKPENLSLVECLEILKKEANVKKASLLQLALDAFE